MIALLIAVALAAPKPTRVVPRVMRPLLAAILAVICARRFDAGARHTGRQHRVPTLAVLLTKTLIAAADFGLLLGAILLVSRMVSTALLGFTTGQCTESLLIAPIGHRHRPPQS